MKTYKKASLVAAMVVAMSTTAWGNAAYSVVDTNYSTGRIGTIASTTGTVNQNAAGPLNGAPAVHTFKDANGQTRVLAYNYSYSAVNPEAVVYNPATATWTSVKSIANLAGTDISNLYGVATIGNYLYAIDYESAKVVKINMTNDSYSVEPTQYTLPGTAGFEKHGVAITAVGNDLYALFTEVNDPWGNANYLTSKVVKLNKDTLAPVGNPVEVGKNAFTLKYYNNKLYVASLGGKQQSDAYNSGQSRINVVNLATMTVTTPFTAGVNIPYDFRDITIGSNGTAYILVGKYINNYATMQGQVYKTTATAIDSGNIGIPVQQQGATSNTFNTGGFCWALHYESSTDRLWFAKGNQVELHAGSSYNPIRTPMPAGTVLSPATYPNLNSITLFDQGVTLRGYQAPGMSLGQPSMTSGQANMKAAKKIKTEIK